MLKVSIIVLAFLCAGCGAASVEPEPNLPSPREVAGSTGARDLVAKSDGVEPFQDLPTLGWELQPSADTPMEWVVLRIPYVPEMDGAVPDFISADTPHAQAGMVYFAVADFAQNRWVWHDCSAPGWLPGHDYTIGAYLTPDLDILDPDDKAMYVAVVAYGQGSYCIANGFAQVTWPDQ